MRQLTEAETKTLFDKLANYTGRSLTNLIALPSSDSSPSERYVFRLHNSRVYYLKLALANLATSVARENLLSLGTCLGKVGLRVLATPFQNVSRVTMPRDVSCRLVLTRERNC